MKLKKDQQKISRQVYLILLMQYFSDFLYKSLQEYLADDINRWHFQVQVFLHFKG